MSRWSTRQWLAMLIITSLAIAGCGGGRANESPTVAPTAVSSSTVPPTPSGEPVASPDGPDASLGEPPVASLAAEGGDPVTGSLGSFTWGDGGSDSPWLPGAQIVVAPGEPLTVSLPAEIPVKDWTAKRVPTGTADGVGAFGIAAGDAAPITFAAPGPGSWSVQVMVDFGDSLGSATYYWQVTVR